MIGAALLTPPPSPQMGPFLEVQLYSRLHEGSFLDRTKWSLGCPKAKYEPGRLHILVEEHSLQTGPQGVFNGYL